MKSALSLARPVATSGKRSDRCRMATHLTRHPPQPSPLTLPPTGPPWKETNQPRHLISRLPGDGPAPCQPRTSLDDDVGIDPTSPTYKPVSSSRTTTPIQEAFAPWLASLRSWDLYLTLTYDSRREGYDGRSPSNWASMSHLVRYHKRASRILARQTDLCGALEATSLGAPHWHGLLCSGGVSPAEFALLSNEWFTHHGYARFARVDPSDTQAVAGYVGKYLTKQGSEVLFLGLRPGEPSLLTRRFRGMG